MNNYANSIRDGLLRFVIAHRFLVLVVGALAVALVFVSIAMTIYENSDAARLDLSHPDYRDLRSEIYIEKAEDFSSSGPVNQEVLEDFEEQFNDSARRVLGADAFHGDVLSDQTLDIDVDQ